VRGATDAAIAAYLWRGGDSSGLNVRDLAISFGGIRAVQGVTFLAKARQVTSLIGANGAGKTTIVNLISGFYTADKGSIALNEMELSGAPAWKIARAGNRALLPDCETVRDPDGAGKCAGRDAPGTAGNPLARPWPNTEIATALGCCGFPGYRGDPEVYAGTLPHAERRLVEIARALATQPKVLLLDEPAAGLLKPEREALRTLVPAIAQLGIAVVLIEHDTSLVMEISDYIVVLDAGRLLAEGTPPEIHGNPRVREAYFGGADVSSPPGRAALKNGRDRIARQKRSGGLRHGDGCSRIYRSR
jgi:branched-chain amino acid transport system permease protein